MNLILYALNQGRYWDGSSYVYALLQTKQEAGRVCRVEGFKWDSDQQMFCNEKKGLWVKVTKHKVGEINSGVSVSYGYTKRQQEKKGERETYYGGG